MIAALSQTELHIPFRTAFRHASAERRETAAVCVRAESGDGIVGWGEGCPRPYVTGETLDSARRFFDAHEAGLRGAIGDLGSLGAWTAAHADDIDGNPAAWCAIEIALLDVLAREAGWTLEGLLDRPPLSGRFAYTAVVGDAEPAAFAAAAERYARAGFTDFKVKLSGDLASDRAKSGALLGLGLPTLRVRVDANNLWAAAPEAIAHLRALDVPLFAVEEPLAPRQYEALARVAEALNTHIVLDESLTRADQLGAALHHGDRWIANVRVSKMGGVLRSLATVTEAARLGVRVIVGAQVGETSILTRAGLTVAAAAAGNLIAQEGAFGTHLLAHDVCNPSLMFGAAGILDADSCPSLSRPGLGIDTAV
jgi:L-alanine-DL-glutamate epimerase-like enolase superfamily enzyme